MKKIKSLFAAAVFAVAGSFLGAADGVVSLSCNYPGGNVKIIKIQPGCAEIAPDLRDNRLDWFYWNFDAVATEPGTVHFCFPEKQSKISAQGPAVSTDGGKTWTWLGKAKTHFRNKEKNRDSFEWTFTKAGEKVRFAQGIPYTKERFERFYDKHKASPYMKREVLTKTRKGNDSPLLIIGNGPENILMTARHHACEAIASYAVEGFVTEAISDSPAGKDFRSKYTLYVVPFVDLDGVIAGDQGKNRAPHDHNRDYAIGDAGIYPEIREIQALDKEKKFIITLDMHAPSIRNDIHEAIYFAGFKTPINMVHTNELKKWLDMERPLNANMIVVQGKSSVTPPDGKEGAPNSLYFATNPTTIYGMTFELPYATWHPGYNEKTMLHYGKAILKAITKTKFSRDLTPRTAHKEFMAFVQSVAIGRPDLAIKACSDALAKNDLPGHYRSAALVARALAYGKLKQYKEALADNEAVLASSYALQSQKYAAAEQKTQVLCMDPSVLPETIDAWVKTMLDQQLVEGAVLFNVCEILYKYYNAKKMEHKAVAFAKMSLPFASRNQFGAVRNRIAAYELKYGDKEKAFEYTRTTAKLLKNRFSPTMPVGVFGPILVVDYVDAISMLPETTLEDVKNAAELALKHKLCRDAQRAYLEQKIKNFKAK